MGRADLIGMARQLLADPDWPKKVREGHGDRVVPCVYNNVCKALDEAVRQEIASRTAGYPGPRDFFIDRLAEGVGTIAAAFYPKPVIVRMSDFKSNEYAALLGGSGFIACFTGGISFGILGKRGDREEEELLRVGESVKLAYVDQSRDALDAKKTVWEEISDGHDIMTVGDFQLNSRAYVGRFNFRGSDQQKRVGDLSGGERNRVHLAKLLTSGGNLLLLDEPTNDLDVETLRALEEALLEFPGCAVIISHDRWFLDRIATHILAFEGDSRTTWFEGNYADYEEDRKRRLGAEADQPHRIRYRKLAS